jgi:hypothetical protein
VSGIKASVYVVAVTTNSKVEMTDGRAVVPMETVERRILLIRGQKVLLDMDLADLYAVETRTLKRAVRRNRSRFPPDFMFELTSEEYRLLRCQIGTLKRGQHAKYLPLAFTEQGLANRMERGEL